MKIEMNISHHKTSQKVGRQRRSNVIIWVQADSCTALPLQTASRGPWRCLVSTISSPFSRQGEGRKGHRACAYPLKLFVSTHMQHFPISFCWSQSHWARRSLRKSLLWGSLVQPITKGFDYKEEKMDIQEVSSLAGKDLVQSKNITEYLREMRVIPQLHVFASLFVRAQLSVVYFIGFLFLS